MEQQAIALDDALPVARRVWDHVYVRRDYA